MKSLDSESGFDVYSYAKDNLDRVALTSTGQITAACPWCEKHGGFYINSDTGHFICHKCEQRGRYLVGLVAFIEDVSWQEAKKLILRQAVKFRRKETPQTLLEKIRNLRPVDDGESADEDDTIRVELPKAFIPVYRNKKWCYPSYLKSRGIKRATARQWNLGYCESGKYKGRIVVPIECPNGYSFTARDATDAIEDDWPKIMNPPGAGHARLLLGWPQMKIGSDIALVEGPFDALKWSQHGIQTLALMGKTVHPGQMQMLRKLPADTSVTVALDPEETKAPYVAADRLSQHFDNVYVAQLPLGVDPGASTKKQARRAYEDAQKFSGRSDVLVAKLRASKKKLKQVYQ